MKLKYSEWQNARTVPIADEGQYYLGKDVETALIEIADGTTLDDRYVNVTGDVMTGNLRLNDDVKLILGSEDGGEIYSSNDNLFITNEDDGKDIYLQTDNSIVINEAGTAAIGADLLKIKGSALHTGSLTEWQNSSGTRLTEITADGRIGIGVTPSIAWFDILKVETASTGFRYGGQIIIAGNPSVSGNLTIYGLNINAQTRFANNMGAMRGLNFRADYQRTGGTINAIDCVYTWFNVAAGSTGGTANTFTNIYIDTSLQSGTTATVTNFRHIYIDDLQDLGATAFNVTNAYGLQIKNIDFATNNWALETNAGNVVFNQQGDADSDFRVEGNTIDNVLEVDAGDDELRTIDRPLLRYNLLMGGY